MTDIEKEEIVKILLMPIKCIGYSNHKPSITIENGAINTTQTYYPQYVDKVTKKPFRYAFEPDCDMSDFAVGFYEILYIKYLRNQSILTKLDSLTNYNYAGDTMNSFNTIANTVPEAGKSSKLRTPENQWPRWLQDYYKNYHCLANFWLLPMHIGRTSKWTPKCLKEWSKSDIHPIQDYMDRFLILLKQNYKKYKEELYTDYFQKIQSFEKFAEIHMLKGSYVDESYEINRFSIGDVDKAKVGKMVFEMIKKRAVSIANSDCAEELLLYFKQNSLIR